MTTVRAVLDVRWRGIHHLLLACLGAAALAGCGNRASPSSIAVERTDSSGVEIVTSRGADHALAWRFERAGSISSEDGGGAGVLDPRRDMVRTDAHGRIYLLDTHGNRILVFDDQGSLLRVSGGKGGGPGEMGHVIAFAVAEDGTAGAYDIAKRRLVRFGPEGEVVPELDPGRDYMGGALHMGAEGVLHDFSSSDRETGRSVGGIHLMANGTETVVLSRELPAFKPIELKSCGMSFSGMPPLFAAGTRWSAAGGRLASATSHDYEIEVRENGRHVRTIRRDLPLRQATKELAMQDLGDGMRVGTQRGVRICSSDEVVEQRGFARYIPVVGALIQAPGGELWVRRGGVKGEDSPIDLFAADGAYLGTLPPSVPFPAAFLPDGRIVAVEQDEDDQGHVVMYRVRR